jgi:hypothetical protein
MQDYGIKELYSVALKATYNMDIGEKTYEKDEVILRFDKILIAHINEDRSSISATGGYNNKSLITWDNTKDVRFTCTEGVLSKTSLAVISNSKIIQQNKGENISVPVIGEEITPVNGYVTLKHKPNGTGFIYNKETGEKLYSNLTEQTYATIYPVVADYNYDYSNGADTFEIGNKLFKGYIKLEGKMRLKDDSDGHDKNAIITIPHIKIISSLAMRLGKNADPTVGNFSFIGYPTGMRGAEQVMSIQVLNDDIDSDF